MNKLYRHKKLIIALTLISVYPAILLGYVWYHCIKVELDGGKAGKLDAYRHTLASAVLAYTFSPKAVLVITDVMEFGNSAQSSMDRQNNAIGATIGAHVRKFEEIEPMVLAQVKNGTVDAPSSTQTTWLHKDKWGRSLFW